MCMQIDNNLNICNTMFNTCSIITYKNTQIVKLNICNTCYLNCVYTQALKHTYESLVKMPRTIICKNMQTVLKAKTDTHQE